MIRLIKFLFTGSWHEHKWETIKVRTVESDSGGRWFVYECKCETCGKIKGFKP
jgi:hypothetical protein